MSEPKLKDELELQCWYLVRRSKEMAKADLKKAQLILLAPAMIIHANFAVKKLEEYRRVCGKRESEWAKSNIQKLTLLSMLFEGALKDSDSYNPCLHDLYKLEEVKANV